MVGKEIDDHLVSYELQYKLPDSTTVMKLAQSSPVTMVPLSQISKCYQFASAVVMFGGMLRNSKYFKDASWNSIMQIAGNAADQENFSQKEFLSLVQQAKAIYGKKRKREKEE